MRHKSRDGPEDDLERCAQVALVQLKLASLHHRVVASRAWTRQKLPFLERSLPVRGLRVCLVLRVTWRPRLS
jgi:hypothetical protein